MLVSLKFGNALDCLGKVKMLQEHRQTVYLLTAALIVGVTVSLRQNLHRGWLEHGNGAGGVVGKVGVVERPENVFTRKQAKGFVAILGFCDVDFTLGCEKANLQHFQTIPEYSVLKYFLKIKFIH